MKMEIVLGKFNNAEALCDELEEKVESMMNELKVDEKTSFSDIMMPKFHQKDGKIICGLQVPVEKRGVFRKLFRIANIGNLKIPYEIQ